MKAEACVYRCFDSDDRLLYIGMTWLPESRMANHRYGSPWFDQVARVVLSPMQPRAEAVLAEREAIMTENPIHNVKRSWLTLPPIIEEVA